MLIDKKLTTYVDLHELAETFVDCVEGMTFDNLILHMELSVTRPDPVRNPKKQLSGRRYPACRLVMPGPTVVELYNHLSQIINVMEKKGMVKKTPQGPVIVQGPSTVQ